MLNTFVSFVIGSFIPPEPSVANCHSSSVSFGLAVVPAGVPFVVLAVVPDVVPPPSPLQPVRRVKISTRDNRALKTIRSFFPIFQSPLFFVVYGMLTRALYEFLHHTPDLIIHRKTKHVNCHFKIPVSFHYICNVPILSHALVFYYAFYHELFALLHHFRFTLLHRPDAR